MAQSWLWWRAWTGLVAGDAALCVAGVGLGDIYLRFAWQVWHWATSTFVSRGRCGTWRHPLSFAWQVWHLGHWAGSGGTLGRGLVADDAVALCVAGVALGDIYLRVALGAIYLRFAWQVWHSWHWAGSGGVLGPDWSPVTPWRFAWRGTGRHLPSCGTWRHLPSFCVAGVALMALGWLWWRAWTGLVAGDAVALCVAGVGLGDIYLHFTWQAWHLETSTFVFCAWLGCHAWAGIGRRHFAWQALGVIYLRFAWQAWHHL